MPDIGKAAFSGCQHEVRATSVRSRHPHTNTHKYTHTYSERLGTHGVYVVHRAVEMSGVIVRPAVAARLSYPFPFPLLFTQILAVQWLLAILNAMALDIIQFAENSYN